MGLDMYLKAEKYVGGWNYDGGKDEAFDGLVKLMGIKPIERSPSITVGVTVGYWRKANAIHKWFVDNCQNGVDECQSSHVERSQLEELRDLCKQVLDAVKDGKVDEDLLPTQGGFFFGDTEYGEYYLEDCKSTVEIIDEILENTVLESCDFYYQSSW